MKLNKEASRKLNKENLIKKASRKFNKKHLIKKAPLNTKISTKINQTTYIIIKRSNNNK